MISSRMSRRWRDLLLFFTILSLIILLHNSSSNYYYEDSLAEASDKKIKTARGTFSLRELEDDVLRPLGYRLVDTAGVIPRTKYINPPTCKKAFQGYRDTKINTPAIPPKEMPEGTFEAYSLKNHTNIIFSYMNNKPSDYGPNMWSATMIDDWLARSDQQLEVLGYNGQSASIHKAIKYIGVKDKVGLIVGSLSPWLECMALKQGARKVTTVEYSKIEIDKKYANRMESLHASELADNWHKYTDTFDFALSFSSIEHSGLGRFGDPLDPIGDLREMSKVHCLVKKGGYFLFAVPTGRDGIVFNLHRIYGRLRLALMFAGFEHVATFNFEDGKEPMKLTEADFDMPTPAERQLTFVLRKL